jgi:hypothetical protein
MRGALFAIAWPSLCVFLAGWLSLSVSAAGRPEEIIYLMYAERLIDVNDVSEYWIEENIQASWTVAVGKKLLAGKDGWHKTGGTEIFGLEPIILATIH